ncbi:unnamed protein product [Gordionus sp. m RMFG-2023]
MSSINDNSFNRTISDRPAADREFGEDASWKRIQQNTFTRWVNEHLKTANKHIGNLETDLSDGLRLLSLIEVLSGKKILKYNKRPTFRSQKLENVSMSLNFLGTEEGIKIVNIDSTDIIDCNLKLILGLVWMLILHYSITIPSWDNEEIVETSPKKKGHEPTPKQKLLTWIQSRIPDITITNFTSDWNDGKAIGALVDAVAPGLCPDWPDWDSSNSLDNTIEAMQLAEEYLNVPQLIKPQEMVNKNVDELSMMTYLSQFPSARVKPSAPLRPRTNPSKVRVYGAGIEPIGVTAGCATNFTVETFSAGRGKVDVSVKNITENLEAPVDLKFNNDKNLTYTCIYTPPLKGTHLIDVKFANKEVAKSPFKVFVEEMKVEPSKCVAEGPALQGDLKAGVATFFKVYTKEAGVGVLDCYGQQDGVLNDEGAPLPLVVGIKRLSEHEYLCEFEPQTSGSLLLHVTFSGVPIPNFPARLTVQPFIDLSKFSLSGRGVQARGIRSKDTVTFAVHYPQEIEASLIQSKILNPSNFSLPTLRKLDANVNKERVHSKSIHDGNSLENVFKLPNAVVEFEYSPVTVGVHSLEICCGGKSLPKTPLQIEVMPHKESAIKAYGPGLIGGIVGHGAKFTVETNGETGALGFAVEGPSRTVIDCADVGRGAADVRYVPMAKGEYAIRVLCDDQDIPGSPFTANVIEDPGDALEESDLIKVYGAGIHNVIAGDSPQSIPSSQSFQEFYVDYSALKRIANLPKPLIQLFSPDHDATPVQIIYDQLARKFICKYVAGKKGTYLLYVNHRGADLKDSPWRINVKDPSIPGNVKVSGQALSSPIKLGELCEIYIDTSSAGSGELNVVVEDSKRQILKTSLKSCKINPADTGIAENHVVEFLPRDIGTHWVNVYFDQVKVVGSPFQVNVEHRLEISAIKILDLEPKVLIGSAAEITVDATAIEKDPISAGPANVMENSTPVKCLIHFPSTDKYFEAYVERKRRGIYVVYFNPKEEGVYALDFSYDDISILPKAFEVTAKIGCDPSKVKASGPGLIRGTVNAPCVFAVDTRKAGRGGLGLTIEGPSEAKMNCGDNRDGTCSVAYYPTAVGEYEVSIKFDEIHVTGSPFTSKIYDHVDYDKIVARGPGLLPRNFRSGVPSKFIVDASRTGSGILKVALMDAKRGVLCPIQPTIHPIRPDIPGIVISPSPSPTEAFSPDLNEYNPNRSGTAGIKRYNKGLENVYEVTVVPPAFSPILSNETGAGAAINNARGTAITKTDSYLQGLQEEYVLSVKYNELEIPNFPKRLALLPAFEPEKVKIMGPAFMMGLCTNKDARFEDFDFSDLGGLKKLFSGIEGAGKGKVYASLPSHLCIDASQAGVADIDVVVQDPQGRRLPVHLSSPRTNKLATTWHNNHVLEADDDSGLSYYRFTPHVTGHHVVNVAYLGYAEMSRLEFEAWPVGMAEKATVLENFPRDTKPIRIKKKWEQCFKVDASKSSLITDDVTAKITCLATRQKKNAGSISPLAEKYSSVNVLEECSDVVDNLDGTFTVFLNFDDVGFYKVETNYGGRPVPKGDFEFLVEDWSDEESSYHQLIEEERYFKQLTQFAEFRTVEFTLPPLPFANSDDMIDVLPYLALTGDFFNLDFIYFFFILHIID